MKRIILFLCCVALTISGCFPKTTIKGIRIVGVDSIVRSYAASTSISLTRGTIMRDRYVFSHPERCAEYMLVAEDLEGNVITEGVEWNLENPNLGNLKDAEPEFPWVKRFIPATTGETIVTASKNGVSDTAQIVVYPGYGYSSIPIGTNRGFDFSAGTFVIDESQADIWWPGNGKICFECGYWTDIKLIALIENLDTLTAEGKELIPGPIDYGFATNADQLFLVRAREGAVYAAIVSCARFIYKPIPLIPAP